MGLSSRFETALAFAARLHGEQARKGTLIPYVAHLLGVASIALEYGADEEEAIAALLHDAVEDQGGIATAEVIERCFGERFAQIVVACSDSSTLPKPPWLARKEAYIARLEESTPSERLVSCSDKLHNVRAILRDYREIGDEIWGRFTADKAGVLWYYRTLADVFLRLGPERLSHELDRVVAELEATAG